MNKQEYEAALARVLESDAKVAAKRLAPEYPNMALAVELGLTTWSDIARAMGVKPYNSSRMRIRAAEIHAEWKEKNILPPATKSKSTKAVTPRVNAESEPSTVPPAQTQQPVPPANPNERPSTSDEKFVRAKARLREIEKAEAEAREKAKNEEPELDEESRKLLDMFENSERTNKQ
jgi:hypothetical protein